MTDYIFGRNAVLEQLKSGKEAEKLYVQKGKLQGVVHRIVGMAHDAKLPVIEVDQAKLDRMTEGGNHQGVALLATDFAYSSVEDILASAKAEGHAPFVVLLDELTDPHNVGAIIRSAACFGADGVLLPKRRAATVTSVVQKVSSGATSYVKIAKINNVNQTIDALKKENIWVYGAAGEAKQTLWKTNFSDGVCLVIGNEGKGLAELTRKKCDVLVSIPMTGPIDSLNASCAATVLMAEVYRGRLTAVAADNDKTAD
ncbi:23S rRNA (guanosine(2251)-2'-O)-methyltransferase RlmB [Levyella massiliensis]|uniref:23S rRNA (guanosine(2251)-2'-O)-methyltransferase RlmB n=1 Tax=Levyella massiliensis TaxID=938289 RepID=UPI00399A1A7A